MPLYTGAAHTTGGTDRVPYLRYDALGPNAGRFSDAQDADIVFGCEVLADAVAQLRRR